MESSGQSEFSGESKSVTLSFWQSFLLTLAGASGLISLVANGPEWITFLSGGVAVVAIAWIAVTAVKARR